MTGEGAGRPPRSFEDLIRDARHWPRDLSRMLRGRSRKSQAAVPEATTQPAIVRDAIISPQEEASLAAGERKLAASVRARVETPDRLAADIEAYGAARRAQPPRIVVYTAIAGGYDSLKLPHRLDPRFDYVAFSDRPLPDTGVWQVRPMTWLDADPTRSCRFVKARPHVLLCEYEYAIWLDANVMIVGDLYPIFRAFADAGLPVGGIRHPFRETIQEELAACRRRDDEAVIHRQVEAYRESPGSDVLLETNLMMFDLRHSRTAAFLDAWWREIDRHSRRDQLSVGYALAETGAPWHPLMQGRESTRTHPAFACVAHDGGAGPAALLPACLRAPAVDPFAGPSWAERRQAVIAAQSGRRIDIVICVHNALDHVRACLDSVCRHGMRESQRLVLVDDGSADETRAYLADFARGRHGVTLLRSEACEGYTRAANRGLRATTAEFVILLNSDTVVTDGWAEKLAAAAWSAPAMGVVGPLSNAASHQSIPDHQDCGVQTAVNQLPQGLTPDEMNRFCEQMATAGRILHVPLVHGFCMGIRREVLERIGAFDEANFPDGYGEESDFCFRASDAGFGLAIALHTYVHHAKSQSYAQDRRVILFRRSVDTLRRLHAARVDRALATVRQNALLADIRLRVAQYHALHAYHRREDGRDRIRTAAVLDS